MNENTDVNKNIGKNAVANLIGRVWGMISNFLFLPIYIKVLGSENFGLIGFFSILQVVLNLLSAGLSPTLKREFAIGDNKKETVLYKYKILRSTENIFFIIGCFSILLCFFGSDFIVHKWLNIENIDMSLASTAVKVMGFSIAFQIIASIYTGCILGLEKQVYVNVLQFVFSSSKAIGSIIIILFISPNIVIFFASWAIVDFIYLLVSRIVIINYLKKFSVLVWNISDTLLLRSLWRYAFGVFAISIVSTLNTQLDKILITKYLPLSYTGIYSTAYTLAQIPSITITALSNAVFTRFSYLHSIKNIKDMNDLFKKTYKLFAIIAISLCSFIAGFSKVILDLWLNDAKITSIAVLPVILLSVANALLALQIAPYNYLLAMGKTKENNILGLINIPVLVILLPLLVKQYGIMGAAFSFFIIMLVSTFFYISYFYIKNIGTDFIRWFLADTILPTVFILGILMVSLLIFRFFNLSTIFEFIYAVMCGGITLLISVILFDGNIRKLLKYKILGLIKRG